MVDLVMPTRTAEKEGPKCDELAIDMARSAVAKGVVPAGSTAVPDMTTGKYVGKECRLGATFKGADGLTGTHINIQVDPEAKKAAVTLSDLDMRKPATPSITGQSGAIWAMGEDGKIALTKPTDVWAKGAGGATIDVTPEQKEALGKAADVLGDMAPKTGIKLAPAKPVGPAISAAP